MNPKPSPSGSSFSKSALLKIDQITMKKFITYYPIYSEKLGFVSKYSSRVDSKTGFDLDALTFVSEIINTSFK